MGRTELLQGRRATRLDAMEPLLDVSRELNELIGKVPGLGRLKRKVEEEQAEREDDSQ